MSTDRTPPVAFAMMAASIVGTVVLVGFILVRGLPGADHPTARPATITPPNQVAELGVHARITAGDITVERTLPSLNVSLLPDQSLDARLPAGPFKAEFTVTFAAGDVRQGNVGAVIQGGSLIIRRGERNLLSDHASDDARTAMTVTPESFSRQPQSLTYTFETDGKRPCRLRAMWRPLDSQVPLPLPSTGAPMLASDALRGQALVQQFNCVACHQSTDASRQVMLAVNPSPILGDIGARVRPEWLRSWLAEPIAMNPSAVMPRVFHGSANDPQNIEDLTHFLISLGGPMDASTSTIDHDLVSTGMVTYHSVGCMTCHGPLEPLERLPGRRPTIAQPFRSYTSLGRLSQKTTPAVLSKFLQDPLTHWPGGRMPSMSLTALEADGLAHYLIEKDQREENRTESVGFHLDSARVERGRELFASTGCINCHALGPDRATITPTMSAPVLESLAGDALTRGCLQTEAHTTSLRFAMSSTQRSAIGSYLQDISHQRSANTPLDALAVTMARLNCTACHEYHDERGPETAISQYFSAVEEADLGDEGRVPPNLSDVGARLNPGAIRQMLDGEMKARPYMGVRMPVFGTANTDALPSCFAAAAGVPDGPDHGPAVTSQLASIGRELVGSKGMNCIQCHNVAGRASTGTPGPDLSLMAERLRFDAFARWLHDPSNVRPGTRMPSFFASGVSGFTQHLNGEAEPQIQAIWAYLSQGEFMPLPDGLTGAAGLALQPTDRPIVFRSFLKQGGVRAIACGFPEQVHCSFDAEQCRLTAIWTGEFINASGAWAARGGTQTNPGKVAWQAPADPPIRIHLGGNDPAPADLQFHGYRLDSDGRPIFKYDASSGGITVHVEEQPIPVRENGKARVIRRFTLLGSPGLNLSVVGQGVELDRDGKGKVDVEITW